MATNFLHGTERHSPLLDLSFSLIAKIHTEEDEEFNYLSDFPRAIFGKYPQVACFPERVLGGL
jgi:hypothetical protein